MLDENLEMLIYIVEGVLICVANLPVTLVIFFSSKFKNAREFTFSGGLCLANSIYGLAFVMAGALKTQIYVIEENVKANTMFECYWLPWMLMSLMGYQATALMTLLMSLDRLLAVYLPTWHLNVMTQRMKTCILFVVFTLIVCSTAPLAWFVESNTTESLPMLSVECYVPKGLISLLWSYVLCFRVVVITTSCLVYIPMAKKLRELASKNTSGHKSQLSKHRKLVDLTVTIAVTSAISLVMLVIPDLVFLSDIAHLGSQYHLIFHLISLNNCIINVILFILRHRELRRALVVTVFHCLGRTQTKVSAGKRVLFNTATELQPKAKIYSSNKVIPMRPAPYESIISRNKKI